MDCGCPLPLWGQGKLNGGKAGHGTEGTTDFAGRSYCKAGLKSQQQQIEDEDQDENEEEIHGVDHRRASSFWRTFSSWGRRSSKGAVSGAATENWASSVTAKKR